MRSAASTPSRRYALTELTRCSRDPQLHYGLKLHFGNSDVDLDNPGNVAQVKKVFAAASGFRMPIVVHMRTSLDNKRRYGEDQARVFINELLPAALDVTVQVAHLAGSGGYNDTTDSALGVFADAIAKHDARLKNVSFNASAVVRPGMPQAESATDRRANPPCRPRPRAVRFRRRREPSGLPQGGLGDIPEPSTDAGRVRRDCEQRSPIYAGFSRKIVWPTTHGA